MYTYIYIYVYIHICICLSCVGPPAEGGTGARTDVQPAAARWHMVSHQAFRARRVRTEGIGGEVRHRVTSDVSCETSNT